MTPSIFTTSARRYVQTSLKLNRTLYQGRIYSFQNPPLNSKDGSYTGQVNKKNQPDGKGIFMSPRGKTEGTWKNGRFISGIETFEDNTAAFIRDPNGRYSEI